MIEITFSNNSTVTANEDCKIFGLSTYGKQEITNANGLLASLIETQENYQYFCFSHKPNTYFNFNSVVSIKEK